jgi:hypothetical protein
MSIIARLMNRPMALRTLASFPIMSYLDPARNYPFVILSVAALSEPGTVLAVPQTGRAHGGSPFVAQGASR